MKKGKSHITTSATGKTQLHIEASASNGIASIRLTDTISAYTDSNSKSIKTIVDNFISQGIKQGEVYINSAGGSVFEMNEICNDLSRLDNVKIIIGALAASAATYPATKFKTAAHPNSQVMIHRPMMGAYGNEKQIEAQLKLLQNITTDYKNAYATKTGKTADEVESLWANGDYWMTAQQALQQGLIDEILPENENITAETKLLLVACGCPNIPEEITNQTNDMNRDELIASLGLAKDATDEQIKAKIAENKAKAEKADGLEASTILNAQTNAEALVNNAIIAKKITADKKETYIKLALTDFDRFLFCPQLFF